MAERAVLTFREECKGGRARVTTSEERLLRGASYRHEGKDFVSKRKYIIVSSLFNFNLSVYNVVCAVDLTTLKTINSFVWCRTTSTWR